MATHSSVLAWRIPGTGEPGGLPSMGSHRVGHWSDLAAAAATYWGRQQRLNPEVWVVFSCRARFILLRWHVLTSLSYQGFKIPYNGGGEHWQTFSRKSRRDFKVMSCDEWRMDSCLWDLHFSCLVHLLSACLEGGCSRWQVFLEDLYHFGNAIVCLTVGICWVRIRRWR